VVTNFKNLDDGQGVFVAAGCTTAIHVVVALLPANVAARVVFIV